jgi:hypothetical protein
MNMYKKPVIILLFALCLTCFQAQSQRCLPRQTGVQFTAGTVNGLRINPKNPHFAFHAGMAFSVYAKHKNRWVFGCEYLEKRYTYKKTSIPLSQFTAEAGFYLGLIADRSKTFFVSLGASALGGYETVNWDRKLLFDGATIENKNCFLYGGAVTLETETFLGDRLALLVNVRQRVLFGSSVGKFNTQFGIGLKFILN